MEGMIILFAFLFLVFLLILIPVAYVIGSAATRGAVKELHYAGILVDKRMMVENKKGE
jgi:uncharacterized protein (UPF0333 family)